MVYTLVDSFCECLYEAVLERKEIPINLQFPRIR